jgi:hypothetical protein
MSTALTAAAGLLPQSLRGYAKAIVPLVAALIAALVQYLNTGTFDDAAMATAVTGASTALLTALTSNQHDVLHDEEADIPDADGLALSLGNYPAPPDAEDFSDGEPLVNGPRDV